MKMTIGMIRGFLEASRVWDVKNKKIISRIKFLDNTNKEEIVLIKRSNISAEATKWENKYLDEVNLFHNVKVYVKGKNSTNDII